MPKNATSVRDERFYRWPGSTDYMVPSVTTVLQAYPRPWLGRWAAKSVAEATFTSLLMEKETRDVIATWAASDYLTHREQHGCGDDCKFQPSAIRYLKEAPWRKRDDAGVHGTAVHGELEALMTGLPLTRPDLAPHTKHVIEWWERFRGRVVYAEKQVFSQHGYGGTFDVVADADADGARWLIDLKTSDEPHWSEWALQLAAYGYADLIADGDDILAQYDADDVPWADRFGVLHVPRSRPANWSFVQLDVTRDDHTAFLAVSDVWAYDKRAIGHELLIGGV